MKNDLNAFVGHRIHAYELAWHRPGKLCGAHENVCRPDSREGCEKSGGAAGHATPC